MVDGQTLTFTREVLFQNICLPMIWIVLMMVIGRFLWRVCFFGSAVCVQADLRERMFDHSRRLSQQYYQVNKVGSLMSLYTNDLDTIQECFGDGILMFFDALVLGLLALYKMWRMDFKLTLLALIPAAIMFGIGTIMGTTMTKRWEERQKAFSDLSDFAQENFSGIAVIKAFVKEFKELTAFRKLNRENEEINVTYTKIATLLEVLVTLFVESVICVILGYGGWLVYGGQFNAGQLVEYIGYFESIVWPIMAISMLIEKTSRGKASLNRITELMDAPVDVTDRDGVGNLENPKEPASGRGFRECVKEISSAGIVDNLIHAACKVGRKPQDGNKTYNDDYHLHKVRHRYRPHTADHRISQYHSRPDHHTGGHRDCAFSDQINDKTKRHRYWLYTSFHLKQLLKPLSEKL